MRIMGCTLQSNLLAVETIPKNTAGRTSSRQSFLGHTGRERGKRTKNMSINQYEFYAAPFAIAIFKQRFTVSFPEAIKMQKNIKGSYFSPTNMKGI